MLSNVSLGLCLTPFCVPQRSVGAGVWHYHTPARAALVYWFASSLIQVLVAVQIADGTVRFLKQGQTQFCLEECSVIPQMIMFQETEAENKYIVLCIVLIGGNREKCNYVKNPNELQKPICWVLS